MLMPEDRSKSNRTPLCFSLAVSGSRCWSASVTPLCCQLEGADHRLKGCWRTRQACGCHAETASIAAALRRRAVGAAGCRFRQRSQCGRAAPGRAGLSGGNQLGRSAVQAVHLDAADGRLLVRQEAIQRDLLQLCCQGVLRRGGSWRASLHPLTRIREAASFSGKAACIRA